MDDIQTPSCPTCGTVLVDVAKGLRCRHCDVVHLPSAIAGARRGRGDLPPSVDEIMDDIGAISAVYGHLKWNERDRLKADMINARQRWVRVDPAALRRKCVEVGLPERSIEEVLTLLKRTQRGDRMIVPKGERGFVFDPPPEAPAPSPARTITNLIDW